MSSNDMSTPIKESDLKKARSWYTIICWGAFLIILLPVGIANFVFGYIFGDSPCTLCWGQREFMCFIGVMGFFIVRYGFKPKYLATLLLMSSVGIYASLRHISIHAARDLGQGFGMAVFGVHTQMWAEIVFWCSVFLLSIAFFFAPRFDALVEEFRGKAYRELTKFNRIALGIVIVILASNAFQAFWGTGLPPYWGHGQPVRFSFDWKYNHWTDKSWHGMWHKVSLLGPRAVETPDFAYEKDTGRLGLKWDHNAKDAPVDISGMLAVNDSREIPIKKPLETLSLINGKYMVASKWDFWALNEKTLQPEVTAEIDPWYAANILDIVGITPYKDGFILMGMNKTLLQARLNPKADDIKEWANFPKGRDQVEHMGTTGRFRIATERAKFNYVLSTATDGKYLYMATVPDNLTKNFVISMALEKDMALSAEWTPEGKILKKGRSLNDLYVTGMTFEDGSLWAVSKNFNVLVRIDPKAQEIVQAWGLPADLKDVRGLVIKDGKVQVLNENHLVTLAFPQ